MTVCVTNHIPDVHSCAFPGEHEPACDGQEQSWSYTKWELTSTGNPCPGCLPKPAHIGFVCASCYESVLAALVTYDTWSRAFRGETTSATRDGRGGTTIGYVPLTHLQLAKDALERYRRSYPGRLDTWIATPEGAEDAVRFALEMKAATTAHKHTDSPLRIRHVRCSECKQLSLTRIPPGEAGAPITVTCRCGHIIREGDTTTSYVNNGDGDFVLVPADKVATIEAIEEYVRRKNGTHA